MTNILNLTRGCHLKRNQAVARIEAKTAVWVEPGKSIRELNLAEVIALRNASAKDSPGCFSSELPGLIWEPPAADKYTSWGRRPLLYEAAKLLQANMPVPA